MTTEVLFEEIKTVILNYSEINELQINQVDINTPLMGRSTEFDSMDLVSILVETETHLNTKFNKNIQIVSEKAMSRRTSPFMTVDSLIQFIQELI